MEASSYLQVVLALILVLGLIVVMVVVMRRTGFGGIGPRGKRRLRMVEAIAVDNRRRLVLVERDDRQHLLLVGGTQDLVVETGIARPPEQVREAKPKPAAERGEHGNPTAEATGKLLRVDPEMARGPAGERAP